MVAEDFGCSAFENQNNIKYLEISYDDIELTPIQKFYDGANVFITGSTGFLGKILVEKLLRSCPTISTLYLLVRKKKGKNMKERVDEMFDDVVFSRLKYECPKYRQKVVGVAGDCSLPRLGLSLQDQKLLIDETNVVFHAAATVSFDEKLKIAVAINIRSPRDLVNFSKEMTKLKSFIHVSTVYGNCPQKYIEEKVYPPAIDGKKLMSMTESVPEKMLDDITPRLLGRHPNTYALTKQIAEDIVKQESGNIPLGIFRPAIVVSTYREPLEAWIDNMYGPTGITAGAGAGLIRVLCADPKANANLVPVDMCVNSLIASAWQVGEKFQKAVKENKPFETPVYNYASSNDRPITWGLFMHLSQASGVKNPTSKAVWYYSLSLIKSYPVYLLVSFLLHFLPAILADGALVCTGHAPRMVKIYKKIHKFQKVISYFAIRQWTLKTDNVRTLLQQMSEKDREIFFSDLKLLDWDDFYQSYFKGIRVYLLKDPFDNMDKAKRKWKKLYYAHQSVKLLSVLLVLQLVYLLNLRLGFFI